jgi:inner membrane protein
MEAGNSFSQTLTHWFKTSLTFKMLVVGFLMIILIIPMFFVSNMILERETMQQEAIYDISSKWGSSQFLVGPVLVIPYKHKTIINGKESFEEHTAYFMPENLDIAGGVDPNTLNRGMYDVTVYNTNLEFKGKFNPPDLEALRIEKENVSWNDAYLCFGVSDMKGIKENIRLNIDGKDLSFTPGVNSPILNMSGLSAHIGDMDSSLLSDGAEFRFNVNVNGSQALNFAPLGKETKVNLISSWVNPGFDGSFLPDKREITENGFTAGWKVLNLNRSYPQEWTGDRYKITETYFGVNLLQPVEQYQKIDRSAKYAFLFIFLTFVIFFFVEVINKTRIHPIRYLLVGLALIIFYTLLLSISEIIGFENAYIIAASAVVILITVYSKNFLKTWLMTAFMFLILSALYGFLFFTIQLQDYSLLAGSIGLFVILALLMYFSRKINYEKDEVKQMPEPAVNN